MTHGTMLRDKTRKLLIDRPLSLKIATIATNIGVCDDWLHKFARGKIDNPGVVYIERLHDYLIKYKAE